MSRSANLLDNKISLGDRHHHTESFLEKERNKQCHCIDLVIHDVILYKQVHVLINYIHKYETMPKTMHSL